jgi:hypothetical protein
MSTKQEKSLEGRARRARNVDRTEVRQIARRAMHCGNHGGFMLIDPHCNCVVEGARFELSPEEVIEHCWDRRV